MRPRGLTLGFRKSNESLSKFQYTRVFHLILFICIVKICNTPNHTESLAILKKKKRFVSLRPHSYNTLMEHSMHRPSNRRTTHFLAVYNISTPFAYTNIPIQQTSHICAIPIGYANNMPDINVHFRNQILYTRSIYSRQSMRNMRIG